MCEVGKVRMPNRGINIALAAACRSLAEQFSEFGWDVHRKAAPSGMPGGPTIYICQLYAVRLIAGGVEKLQAMAAAHEISFQEACNTLGSVLDESAVRATFTQEVRDAMTVNAGLYLGGTQIYRLGTQLVPSLTQYVVIRHYDVSTQTNMLRPVGYWGSEPMSPQDVCEFVNETLEVDRKMHPERFRKAQLLLFRPKNV